MISKVIMFLQMVIILLFASSIFGLQAQGLESSIPTWLENSYEWKNQGKISDSEFVKGISWLIDSKIIIIPTEPPIKNISETILEIKQNWNESFANTILEDCGNGPHCVFAELEKLENNNTNEKTILKTYYDLMDYYKTSNFSCHQQSHHIAEFLYAYFDDVNLALDHDDPMMCGGGNYHAIVYSHMQSQIIFNNVDPQDVDISSICPNDPPNEPTISRWECIHGIGHGLTKISSDTFSAANRCEEFENDWERVSCSKGVFMENIGNFYDDGSGAISSEDLFYPCNKLEQESSSPCYHYQTRHVYFQNNHNFKLTFEGCEKAPPGFEKYCYRGLGNIMAFNVNSDSNFSNLCLDALPDSQEFCYLGIAMKYADNRNIKEALSFCSTIPEDFQKSCYGEVGKWIKMVYDQPIERLEACLVSNNLEYFEECIKADFNEMSIL